MQMKAAEMNAIVARHVAPVGKILIHRDSAGARKMTVLPHKKQLGDRHD